MADDVFNRVRTLLETQLGVDSSDVTPESRFYGTGQDGSLGCDSLDAIELVMAAEEEFGFDIPDGDADQLETVAAAVAYIEERQQKARGRR